MLVQPCARSPSTGWPDARVALAFPFVSQLLLLFDALLSLHLLTETFDPPLPRVCFWHCLHFKLHYCSFSLDGSFLTNTMVEWMVINTCGFVWETLCLCAPAVDCASGQSTWVLWACGLGVSDTYWLALWECTNSYIYNSSRVPGTWVAFSSSVDGGGYSTVDYGHKLLYAIFCM